MQDGVNGGASSASSSLLLPRQGLYPLVSDPSETLQAVPSGGFSV